MLRNLSFLLLVSLWIFSSLSSCSTSYHWDDPRINILGKGWDILENEPRESFFVLVSEDRADPTTAIKTQTLANGVIMLNKPQGTLSSSAEVISYNVNIDNSVKVKVDGGASFWTVKGSFSVESQTVKQFVSKTNHKATRVYATVELASFDLQTTGMQLAPGLEYRLGKIHTLLEKKTNVSLAYAIEMVDEVLNLYGTHFVISETVGGILSKIDAVDITSYQNNVDQTLSASASASFFDYFHIDGQITTENSNVETYDKSVSDVLVTYYGGSPWKSANSTYDTWAESLAVNPATTGVKVSYILDIIRDQYLPNISFDSLTRMRSLFSDRLYVYLQNNYYRGCNDPTASNYVSYANVFDKNLCNYQHTFHLGGIYTVSNVASFNTANILTEGFSCPEGYEVYPLLYQWFTIDNSHFCDGRVNCYNSYINVETKTYVCLSNENRTDGMYFGGVYTESLANDITNAKSCPDKYIAFPIYHNGVRTLYTGICMAPYDVGSIVALPFGGIFSSQYPNYMIGDKPVCGDGFERHSVGPRPIAEISYCIGLGSLESETRALIPPGYGKSDIQMRELYSLYQFDNGTMVGLEVDPWAEMSYDQQIGIKLAELKPSDIDESWLVDSSVVTNLIEDGGVEKNTVFVIVAICSIIVVACIVAVVVAIRYARKRQEYHAIE